MAITTIGSTIGSITTVGSASVGSGGASTDGGTITSTEMWSRVRSVCTTDTYGRRTWQLERGWIVVKQGGSQILSDTAALTATPLDGRQMPSPNDPHPERPDSKVRGYEFEKGEGPMSRIVVAKYDVPPFGQWEDNSNPLTQPWQIQPDWQYSDRELEVDFADTPKPVVNSAGVFFETGSGPSTLQSDPGFVFVRYEPMYPLQLIMQLQGTTNKNPVALPGIGLVQDGQAWLAKITADPFSIGAQYVKMYYTIRCRADGWRSRTKDQGYQGWGMPSSSGSGSDGGGAQLGYFADAQGGKLSTPQMLNGSGKPINSTGVKVVLSDGSSVDPVANPTDLFDATSDSGVVDYIDQPSGATGPTYIRFRKYQPALWTNLFS